MNDCNEIMTLGLADVSYMAIFNDFDKTDREVFHGRIIDDFSMLKIDSTTPNKHESIFGIGTNDLRNETRAYTNLYAG